MRMISRSISHETDMCCVQTAFAAVFWEFFRWSLLLRNRGFWDFTAFLAPFLLVKIGMKIIHQFYLTAGVKVTAHACWPLVSAASWVVAETPMPTPMPNVSRRNKLCFHILCRTLDCMLFECACLWWSFNWVSYSRFSQVYSCWTSTWSLKEGRIELLALRFWNLYF